MLLSIVSTILRRTPLAPLVQKLRNRRHLARWRQQGCPVPPPPAYKHRRLCELARVHGLSTLVETGTFQGDAVAAGLREFKSIYTIELSADLHRRAVERFRHAPHVRLLQGDSGQLMPKVLAELTGPALFWLDGHYSGAQTAKGALNCPIEKELEAILAHPIGGHVILIDDARLFVGRDDYPTLAATQALIYKRKPRATIAVEHDAIRVCLPVSAATAGRHAA